MSLGEVRQQSQAVCQGVQDPGLTRKGHITGSSRNPNMTPKEITEHQNWIQDKFHFLKLHIRSKGPSKSSGFKSQTWRASALAASTHNISRASTDTGSMMISIQSTDITFLHQQVTRLTAAAGHSLVDQQVMDQFTQMRTILSSFLRQKQETKRTAFCNYLALKVED